MREVIADYPYGYSGWPDVVMIMRRAGVYNIVKNAVLQGDLKPAKQCLCVDCGSPAVCYEHRDYDKPLDVSPVCRRCDRLRGMAKPYINRESEDYADRLKKAKDWYNYNLNKNTMYAKKKRQYVLSAQRNQRKNDRISVKGERLKECV